MNILLTNDDSHESPLFLLGIEMLQRYGRVTIVVPADIIRARLGRTFYRRCFSAKGDDQYFHDLVPFSVDSDAETDEAVVRSGRASVTRIDLSVLGQEM